MESNYNRKPDFLDSCVILRMILGDIPEQKSRARALLLSGMNFYVDEIAIMETAHVMSRSHYNHTEIVESLQIFLSNPMISYNRVFLDPILETYKTHPSLSLEDCTLAARTEYKRSKVIYTFDKKFAHQSRVAQLVPMVDSVPSGNTSNTRPSN